MNQYFTFPWQLTLRSLIGRGCGIVGGGVLEKILKTNSRGSWNSRGLEKTENFNSRRVSF